MNRLVDYFAIIKYDFHLQNGKIIQRFPNEDWKESPLPQGIEIFCQPKGWTVNILKDEESAIIITPTFFVSILTDINGNYYYCSAFTFYEYYYIDEEFLNNYNIDKSSENYFQTESYNKKTVCAPVCLAILSRLPYFNKFRNVLGIFYLTYQKFQLEKYNYTNEIEPNVILENIIAKLIYSICLPKFGSICVKYSLTDHDVQFIEPPCCPNIPISDCSVATFFKQIGIYNATLLFYACLTDYRILFHSISFQRLTESAWALKCLMYPLKYMNVFIPILPAVLVEIMNTPTPFVIGVHTSVLDEIHLELNEVIMVDLDAGNIVVPDKLNIPLLPEPLHKKILQSLSTIMNPGLEYADKAFPKEFSSPSPPSLLDKEIRAVFLHSMLEILDGYRSCLVINRILPNIFVTFDKFRYMRVKGYESNELIKRLFESMAFLTFISERGCPYRNTDLFDKYIQIVSDSQSMEDGKTQIKHLAIHLSQNESYTTNLQERIPKPESFGIPCGQTNNQVIYSQFPYLRYDAFERYASMYANTCDNKYPQSAINTTTNQPEEDDILKDFFRDYNNLAAATSSISLNSIATLHNKEIKRLVPYGRSFKCSNQFSIIPCHQKRIQTFKAFVDNVLNNHMTEANKTLPSAMLMLSQPIFRVIFSEELVCHAKLNSRSVLSDQQFSLLLLLINEALKNESINDEYGFVLKILPLLSVFCRKLPNGMVQFMYTCVQNHLVWCNLQFWQNGLYNDCQKHLLAHYRFANSNSPEDGTEESNIRDMYRHANDDDSYNKPLLDIAANIVKEQEELTKSQSYFADLNETEESIVYSLVIHYVNQIIYLRIPLKEKQSHVIQNEPKKVRQIRKIPLTQVNSCQLDHLPNTNNQGPVFDSLDNVWEINETIVQTSPPTTVSASMLLSQQPPSPIVRSPFTQSGSIYSSRSSKIPSTINISNLSNNRNEVFTNSSPSYVTASLNGSDNFDAESGFEDGNGAMPEFNLTYEDEIYADPTELNKLDFYENLAKDLHQFILRFVDKVTNELYIKYQHTESLYQMIPGLISMQIEMLENIGPLIQNLPPALQYAMVETPELLPFENVILSSNDTGIPCYLVVCNGSSSQMEYNGFNRRIPAKGSLYITNYRIIFKGMPLDHLVCDQTLLIDVPIMALLKFKKVDVSKLIFSSSYLSPSSKYPKDVEEAARSTKYCLQILSATFLLLKFLVLLPDRTNSEYSIDKIIKTIQALRYPTPTSNTDSMFDNYPAYLGKTLSSSFFKTSSTEQINVPADYTASLKEGLKDMIDTKVGPISAAAYIKKKTYKSKTLKNLAKKTTNLINSVSNKKVSTMSTSIISHNATAKDNNDFNHVMILPNFKPSDSIHNDLTFHSKSESSNHSSLTSKSGVVGAGINCCKPIINITATHETLMEDYKRLGLLPTSSLPSNESNTSTFFKYININENYDLCSSYSSHILLPAIFGTEDISKLAKNFKRNRFPVVIWKHPQTKALLIRCSSLNSAINPIKYLKNKQKTFKLNFSTIGNQKIMNTNFSKQQLALQRNSSTSKNLAIMSPHLKKYFRSLYTYVQISRCPHTSTFNLLEGKNGKISSNNVKPTKNLINQLKTKSEKWKMTLPTKSLISNATSSSKFPLTINKTPPSNAAFYFLTEKSHIKSFKLDFNSQLNQPLQRSVVGDSDQTVQIIAITYPDIRRVKSSFKRLLKTFTEADSKKNINDPCESVIDISSDNESKDVPSTGENYNHNVDEMNPFRRKPPAEQQTNNFINMYNNHKKNNLKAPPTTRSGRSKYLSSLDKCEWYLQIYNVFRIANLVIYLLHHLGSSVVIGLEDGFDITLQISSIVQIMLDPYYRTCHGFKVLVDKEWNGHRFARRHVSHSQYVNNEGFIPLFIQFLDLVYQLQRLFPDEFEYNDFYLSFLAHHSLSGRYLNFLFNSERDKAAFNSQFRELFLATGKESPIGLETKCFLDIFDHVEQITTNSHPLLFRNIGYLVNKKKMTVLNPVFTSIADFKIWPFYLPDSYGTNDKAFNLDLLDRGSEVSSIGTSMSASNPKDLYFMETFQKLKLDPESLISTQEYELPNYSCDRFKSGEILSKFALGLINNEIKYPIYGAIDVLPKNHHNDHNNDDNDSKMDKSNSTHIVDIELIHDFVKTKFNNPQNCNFCNDYIWGFIKSGYTCSKCGANLHDRCKRDLKSLLPTTTNPNKHSLHTCVAMTVAGTSNNQDTIYQLYHPQHPVIKEMRSLEDEGNDEDLNDILKHLEFSSSPSNHLPAIAIEASNHREEGISVEAKNELLLSVTCNKSSDNSSINTSGISTLSNKPGIYTSEDHQALIPSSNHQIQSFIDNNNENNINNNNIDMLLPSLSLSEHTLGIKCNSTFEGYLFKQSLNPLTNCMTWKKRWFVLDLANEQLRYYDSNEDKTCKGRIAFNDINGIYHLYTQQPPPSHTLNYQHVTSSLKGSVVQENSPYFQIDTCNKSYVLAGFDQFSALEWIQKLQNSISPTAKTLKSTS